jgi:hypothetical protein
MAIPPLHFYNATLAGVPGWAVSLGRDIYFLPRASDDLQRVEDTSALQVHGEVSIREAVALEDELIRRLDILGGEL